MVMRPFPERKMAVSSGRIVIGENFADVAQKGPTHGSGRQVMGFEILR